MSYDCQLGIAYWQCEEGFCQASATDSQGRINAAGETYHTRTPGEDRGGARGKIRAGGR